jgi:hypothetical protein
MLKCNVDAAYCLRDEHGRFVQAYAKRFEGRPAEIRESEAMGVFMRSDLVTDFSHE